LDDRLFERYHTAEREQGSNLTKLSVIGAVGAGFIGRHGREVGRGSYEHGVEA